MAACKTFLKARQKPWRDISLAMGVCTTVWFCCSFLLWPSENQHTRTTSLPPRGHFIRSKTMSQKQAVVRRALPPPRVLCMVVTSPLHHQGRASHVTATWGRWGRGACPNTVFLTSQPDDTLHNVIVSRYSSYKDLWGKVVDGLLQVNASAAEWFLKADDDTFLVYPHLLELLAPLDPSQPLYLGLALIYRPEEGEEVTYMSGGAGYVLSRAALQRLQEWDAPALCRFPGHTAYEDVNMGFCMKALGVNTVDTRDALGRLRFLPCTPWRLLHTHTPHPDLDWLFDFSKYKIHLGADSLSDKVVSFHEVRDPVDFYLLQYLMYDLQVLPSGTTRPFRHITDGNSAHRRLTSHHKP